MYVLGFIQTTKTLRPLPHNATGCDYLFIKHPITTGVVSGPSPSRAGTDQDLYLINQLAADLSKIQTHLSSGQGRHTLELVGPCWTGSVPIQDGSSPDQLNWVCSSLAQSDPGLFQSTSIPVWVCSIPAQFQSGSVGLGVFQRLVWSGLVCLIFVADDDVTRCRRRRTAPVNKF